MTRYRRVEPSGVRGRVARLAATSALIVPALVVGVLYRAVPTVLQVVFGICLLVYLVVWVRLPFVGLWWESDDSVLWRPWWRQARRLERESVSRFRDVNNMGWFFVLGWRVVDGRFQTGEIEAEMHDGQKTKLTGTVTSRLVAREQAAILNAWLSGGDATLAPRRSQRNRSQGGSS